MSAITDIKGIGPVLATACTKKRFSTVQKIATASPEAFAEVPGISVARAKTLIDLAKLLLKADSGPADQPAKSLSPATADTSASKKKKKKDDKKKSKKKSDKKKKKKDKKKKSGKKKK